MSNNSPKYALPILLDHLQSHLATIIEWSRRTDTVVTYRYAPSGTLLPMIYLHSVAGRDAFKAAFPSLAA
jgi:hypothetical protein